MPRRPVAPAGTLPFAGRRKPEQRERSAQKAIVDAHRICVVHPEDAILFAVPNGEKRDPVTAKQLAGLSARAREVLGQTLPDNELLRPYGLGVLPGAADLVLLLPGPRTVLIETKRDAQPGSPAGTLSKDQRRFGAGAQRLGHDYQVVHDAAEYLELLRRCGVALRSAVWQEPVKPLRLLTAETKPRGGARKRRTGAVFGTPTLPANGVPDRA